MNGKLSMNHGIKINQYFVLSYKNGMHKYSDQKINIFSNI